MKLEKAVFHAIFPKLIEGDEASEELHLYLQAAANEFDITTPQRLAIWLANIAHETRGLTKFEENLKYSPERLHEVFPRRVPDLIEAERIVARGPDTIAEAIYGKRKDLGNVYPGDGWKFRGRGAPMLTGRTNYTLHGERLHLPLTADPDLLFKAEHTFRAAGDFWAVRNLNIVADRGDCESVRRVWNGGEIGLKETLQEHERIRVRLKVAA